jgi:hypothetical protein
MTGRYGRSFFALLVVCSQSVSLTFTFSTGPSGAVGLWLSIGVLCAKAVVAETIRRAETMAILSVLNIAISLDMGSYAGIWVTTID